MHGVGIVVPVIDNIIMSVFLQYAVVTWSVNCPVGIGLKNTAFIFERPHRPHLRRGVLHPVGMVVTGTRGVGEIIGVATLEHERCLENVLQLSIGNNPFFREEFIGGNGVGSILTPTAGIATSWFPATQLGHSTAKTVVNAPSSEVKILLAVVIAEELRVERDDIMHITVGHHHRVFLSQDVVPGTYWRLAFSHIDVTGLAVVVAEGAVGLLHHVGRPDHLGGGPVHHHVLPVAKILRHPHLCRAIAVARAIGGGIKIIGVAKLADGGVGKIPRDKRISGSWGVPLCRAWQLRAYLERIGKFLQLHLWVGILFRWHRYLLMQCGSSHDDQVQVSQPLGLRDGEARSIDIAIDFLIVSGDAHKPVS